MYCTIPLVRQSKTLSERVQHDLEWQIYFSIEKPHRQLRAGGVRLGKTFVDNHIAMVDVAKSIAPR